MRKDAKIGFAIGGVLLAVLAAYAIVVPKHRNVSSNGVSLVTPPGNARAGQPRGVGGARETTTVTPAPSNADAGKSSPGDKTTDDKTDAVAKTDDTKGGDGVNWAKLLSGSPDAPTLLTTTPAPGNDDTSKAAPAPVKDPSAVANGQTDNTAPVGGRVTSDPPIELIATNTPKTPIVAVNPATQPTGHQYTIKPGQTLSSIAAEVYGNQRFYVAILRANPKINPARLRPGTKVALPDISDVKPDVTRDGTRVADRESTSKVHDAVAGGRAYQVESGDTLYRISKKLFGSPRLADAIYDLNKETIGPDKGRLKLGMVLKLPSAPSAGATASSR